MHIYILPALRKLAASLLLLALTAGIALAAAGKVQFAIGDVKIQDGKQAVRIPKKGDEINSGDTLITGGNGSLQVTLADGGLLAVRPNTQMRIDDYAYSGKVDDKNNKSVFSLAKGTFRSITGAIGQNNKEAYRVNTPGATMGIRGTDHEPAVVLPLPPGQLPQTPLQAAPPGTYDRVNSGQTFIQNPDGLVTLGPNQVGFAPVGGGAPAILPNVPSFYSSAPKPGAAKKVATAGTQSGSTGGTGTSSSTSTGTTDTGTLGIIGTTDTATLSTASTGGSSVSTNTAITTDPTIITVTSTSAMPPTPTPTPTPPPPTGTAVPIGTGLVGAVIEAMPQMGSAAAGSVFVSSVQPTQSILLGASNEVVYFFDGLMSPTVEFFSAGGTLTDQGGVTFSGGGSAIWGRWLPGFTFLDNGTPVATIGDFHYAYSTDITSSTLVTSPGALTGGLYSYVGGTSPTNQNGVVGTILPSNTSLNVNFSAQTVDFSVGTLINGVTLTGSANGSISAFIDPNTGIFSSSGNPTTASGFFVGSAGAGAITSFDIKDGAGNGAVGTAVFENTSPMPPPPQGTLAPIGSGLVGAYISVEFPGDAAGSLAITDPMLHGILLGAQNEVLQIFDATTPTFDFFKDASALTDQGAYNFIDGSRVDWGRWIPGYIVLNNGSPELTVGDFHYAYSATLTPLSLVLTPGALTGGSYVYVGGTSPTDLNGMSGVIINGSASLNVDFLMQTVNLNVGTLINGVTLQGNASGSISAFVDTNAGIIGSTPNQLRAYGVFVGSGAEGAISSFELSDGMNGSIGTLVFERPLQ